MSPCAQAAVCTGLRLAALRPVVACDLFVRCAALRRLARLQLMHTQLQQQNAQLQQLIAQLEAAPGRDEVAGGCTSSAFVAAETQFQH